MIIIFLGLKRNVFQPDHYPLYDLIICNKVRNTRIPVEVFNFLLQNSMSKLNFSHINLFMQTAQIYKLFHNPNYFQLQLLNKIKRVSIPSIPFYLDWQKSSFRTTYLMLMKYDQATFRTFGLIRKVSILWSAK